MPVSFELASRDEPSLSHEKVGQLELAQSDAALQTGRTNPLAIAAHHGVICIADAEGESSCAQFAHARDQLLYRVCP